MQFLFEVSVEVSRTEGKFATRDELADQLREALEGADPGDLTGENDGQYNVDSFDVSEISPGMQAARDKAAKAAAKAATAKSDAVKAAAAKFDEAHPANPVKEENE